MTWDARFQAALERLFATRRIDLVQFEFPQMARFRPPRPVATRAGRTQYRASNC